MAYFQSPIAFQLQSFTNQGLILSGGLIYTYVAGTTTLQNTYTDSTGTVLNSNPIVLDSSGRLTTSVWVTGGVLLKIIIKDSNSNTLATVDNIAGINDITLALASPGTIGGTTPGAATFTTVTANTSVTSPLGTFTQLASTTVAGTLTATGNVQLGDNTTSDLITINGYMGVGVAPTSTYSFYVKGENTSGAKYQIRTTDSSSNTCFSVSNSGEVRTGSAPTDAPYNNTTATAANVVVTAAGILQRSTSSMRYKRDVIDATHGLEDVLKLRSVTYLGINDGDTRFGGLIAEEVDAAGLREFVAYDAAGLPDAVHYGHMVALLINAIKEQNGTIETLKTRVQTLENAGNPAAAV